MSIENWGKLYLVMRDNLELQEYIKNVWLKHRKKIVAFWMDKYAHFGKQTTSRVEGTHSVLKRHLESISNEIFNFHSKMKDVIDGQTKLVETQIFIEKKKVQS